MGAGCVVCAGAFSMGEHETNNSWQLIFTSLYPTLLLTHSTYPPANITPKITPKKTHNRDGPSFDKLNEAQKRVVELELRDFVLGGVSLEGEAKERYNAIQQELAQLSTKFSNNVLDATKVCVYVLCDFDYWICGCD